MTTYTKQVYASLPFQYKITKEKYWDVVAFKSITVNTTDNITLQPYDGVTITYDAPIIKISDGVLPDTSSYDAFVGYPNGVYGSNYLVSYDGYVNYAKVGTPIVKEDTGAVSGFASNNYVTSPSALPSSTYFDMIQKVKFNGGTDEQCVWFTSADRPISFDNAKLGVYQSGWHQGTTVYPAGTYWIRAIYDNTDSSKTLKLYVLADDGYTLDTLPALESWTLEVTFANCADAWSNQTLLLSRNNNTYWKSEMYLSGTKVSTASEVVWTADGEATSILPGIALDFNTVAMSGEHVDFYYCPDDTIAMRHYDATELPDGAVWIGELNEKFSFEIAAYKANFTQVGEVTYSGNLATMAETSSLLANKNTPTISEFFPVTVDLTLKVTPTDISGYNIVFRNNIEGNYAGFRNGRFRMSSGDQGDVFMENGKTYWIRFTQTPQTSSFTCTGHYMEDDGTYTIDTLPEVSNTAWTQGFSTTFQFVTSNNPFYIGNAIADGSTFNGSIDLASVKMRQGTNADTLTTWWKPLGEI